MATRPGCHARAGRRVAQLIDSSRLGGIDLSKLLLWPPFHTRKAPRFDQQKIYMADSKWVKSPKEKHRVDVCMCVRVCVRVYVCVCVNAVASLELRERCTGH